MGELKKKDTQLLVILYSNLAIILL